MSFRRIDGDLSVTKLPDDEEHARKGPVGLPAIGADNQHLLGYIVGGIGSGKSTLLLNLLSKYLKTGSWDYLFWCSPTVHRDRKVKSVLKGFPQCDVSYSEDFPLGEIIDFIDDELERFDLVGEYRGVWQKYLRVERQLARDPDDERAWDSLTERDLELLEKFDYKRPPSYPHGKPTFCVVVDDMLGEPTVFSARMSSVFNRFIVTMRHRRCSVFISVQSFTQTIPPGLRSMINLYALARCKSKKLCMEMATALAGTIEPERFVRMWQQATEGSHNWFVASLLSPEDQRYRRNLDEVFSGDVSNEDVPGEHPRRRGARRTKPHEGTHEELPPA